jgi:hypothetical protein
MNVQKGHHSCIIDAYFRKNENKMVLGFRVEISHLLRPSYGFVDRPIARRLSQRLLCALHNPDLLFSLPVKLVYQGVYLSICGLYLALEACLLGRGAGLMELLVVTLQERCTCLEAHGFLMP